MSDVFKALASEPRRRILNHLAQAPMTVGEIAKFFDMETPSISKHLSILKGVNLVCEQKRGNFVIYSVVPGNLANAMYAFLSPFCPEARKISKTHRADGKSAP